MSSIKVIKFGAVWCGPCKVLSNVWKDVTASTPDVEFVSIDIDEDPDAVKTYSVKSVPTLVYLKDGVEVFRSVGLVTKDSIIKKIAELK